jgi:hypothetical protein
MIAADANLGPVFVVGMNGSGTTMLLDCLGRHPALYAFPRETRLIPYLMSRVKTLGDLRVETHYRQLWDEVRELGVFRQENGGLPVPIPQSWRDEPRSLAAVLDGVFGYFASAAGKRRWCEKTPQHVQHLLALAQLFPTAKFIHVIRDGRDCAVSFQRRWRRQPELTIFRWKKVVAIGRTQGLQLGSDHYFEIRYEDLTATPEVSLRRICEFLELDFDSAVLDSARPYMQAGDDGSSRGLQQNSGKWRTYFNPRIQQRLETIAGRTLAECGYETHCPQADASVPAWQRRVWAGSEAVRQYGREIWRKLNGDLDRSWGVILAKPITALRQRHHNEF